MLILRGVLKLEKIAAHEPTRYAMNGILLDRDPATHEAIAVATDGKRLMECRWSDEALRSDFQAPINLEERAKFFTVVPNEAIKACEKNIPKRGKPCNRYLAVDEVSANGTVKLATLNDLGPNVTEVKSIEGHFPPYAEVIPPSKGHANMKIALNARLLYELAEALHAAHESDTNESAIILEIKDANSPIVVRATGANLSGVKTRAVLMPINHDSPCEDCGKPVQMPGAPRCTLCGWLKSFPEPKAKKDETKAPLESTDKAAPMPDKLPGETTTPDGVRMVPAIFVKPEGKRRGRKPKAASQSVSVKSVDERLAEGRAAIDSLKAASVAPKEENKPEMHYRCVCSYPAGPHTLECLNANPNANPPAKLSGVMVINRGESVTFNVNNGKAIEMLTVPSNPSPSPIIGASSLEW